MSDDEYAKPPAASKSCVRTKFLEDQSDPDEGTWVWAYQVRIENHGAETVQLLRRTWRITDARGRIQIVQGEGVVGEQPVLEPGEMLRIHVRHPARHAVRHHGRRLPHGRPTHPAKPSTSHPRLQPRLPRPAPAALTLRLSGVVRRPPSLSHMRLNRMNRKATALNSVSKPPVPHRTCVSVPSQQEAEEAIRTLMRLRR